jgi:uncharacterized Tic20 family protein
MHDIVPNADDDKTMAMVSWILTLFTGFIGPLIIWAIKKDQSKFVAFHAMQGVFFSLVVTVASILTFGIAGIAGLIGGIIWALKAQKGETAPMPVIGGWAASAIGVK